MFIYSYYNKINKSLSEQIDKLNMINARQNDIIFTIYHKMRISNDKLENRKKMTDKLITSLLLLVFEDLLSRNLLDTSKKFQGRIKTTLQKYLFLCKAS